MVQALAQCAGLAQCAALALAQCACLIALAPVSGRDRLSPSVERCRLHRKPEYANIVEVYHMC